MLCQIDGAVVADVQLDDVSIASSPDFCLRADQ
jgi:hypothetical protein